MSLEDTINETTRLCNIPLWKATEYLLEKDGSWLGTAKKVAALFALVVAAPCRIFGEALHAGSNYFFHRPYLSYESQAPKRIGVPQSFMSLNACMLPGGLPIPFGGMTPAAERMDRMAAFIKKQDADVICLQEVAYDPATQLINKLKDHYRYFYYRIGPNPFLLETTLFFASKYPLTKEPIFVPFDVAGGQWGIRRGFFVAEFENCTVITTHLDPKAEKGEIRAEEIKKILAHIETCEKPLFLIGDLNLDPTDARAIELLIEKKFPNFNPDDVKNPKEETATCLDNIEDIQSNPNTKAKWTCPDHVLSSKGEFVQQRIKMFDPNNLKGALSDHHAVKLVLPTHSEGNG